MQRGGRPGRDLAQVEAVPVVVDLADAIGALAAALLLLIVWVRGM